MRAGTQVQNYSGLWTRPSTQDSCGEEEEEDVADHACPCGFHSHVLRWCGGERAGLDGRARSAIVHSTLVSRPDTAVSTQVPFACAVCCCQKLAFCRVGWVQHATYHGFHSQSVPHLLRSPPSCLAKPQICSNSAALHTLLTRSNSSYTSIEDKNFTPRPTTSTGMCSVIVCPFFVCSFVGHFTICTFNHSRTCFVSFHFVDYVICPNADRALCISAPELASSMRGQQASIEL